MVWVLLALMVILGGFLSYYGDLQGRRWGKRRVSWFGLRPKHTAILITSLTGAFIALLSIATLLLVAPTIRRLVLHGEQLIEENRRIISDGEKQTRAANGRLQETQKLVEIARAKSDGLGNELDAKRLELSEKRRRLQELQAELNAIQAQVSRLERVAHDLQGRNHHLVAQNDRLMARNRDLVTQNQRLVALNQPLAEQLMTYGQQNYYLTDQNSVLEKKNVRLVEANDQLIHQGEDLVHKNEVLTRINDTQRQVNDNLDAQAHALETKIQNLEAQVVALTHKQDDLIRQFAGKERNFAQEYLPLRQGQINLRRGAELARRVLDAHLRPEAARQELIALLKDASATAQYVYEASAGDNGRAVQIVSKRVVTAGGSEEADENASLDALSANVAGSDTPVVVVAHAVVNSIKGEQALIDLRAHAVHPAFKKGETIAARIVDARLSLDKLLSAIQQFQQKEIFDAATQAGMIPMVSAATGETYFGTLLDTGQAVAVAEQIRRLSGNVQMTAVAAISLNTASPLRVEFKVTRVPAHHALSQSETK